MHSVDQRGSTLDWMWKSKKNALLFLCHHTVLLAPQRQDKFNFSHHDKSNHVLIQTDDGQCLLRVTCLILNLPIFYISEDISSKFYIQY